MPLGREPLHTVRSLTVLAASLAALCLAGCGSDLPERSQVFIVEAEGGSRTQVTNDGLWHNGVDWSHDGAALISSASNSARGCALRIEPATGERKGLARTEAPAPPEVDWSPAGDRVAVLLSGGLGGRFRLIVSRGDGSERHVVEQFQSARAAGFGPSWSKNGALLAYVLPSPDRPPRVAPPPRRSADDARRPAANRVARVADRLAIRSMSGGRPRFLPTGADPDDGLSDPKVSPTGKAVLVTVSPPGRAGSRLTLAPLDDGAPRVLVRGLVAAAADWSPGGTTIAMSAVPVAGDRRYRLYVVRADRAGGALRPVSPELVGSLRPRFSPDGTRLAYLGGSDAVDELRVRDIKSGRVSTVMTFSGGEVSDIAWSPDGRQIAFTAQRRAPYD